MHSSLLNDGTKDIDSMLEFISWIRGLHSGAHHGNVVALRGNIVSKGHTGDIDVWRGKLRLSIILILISMWASVQYERIYATVVPVYTVHKQAINRVP